MDPTESDYFTDSDASVDMDDLFQFLDRHNSTPTSDEEADHSFDNNLFGSPIDPEELIRRLQEQQQQGDNNINGNRPEAQDDGELAATPNAYQDPAVVLEAGDNQEDEFVQDAADRRVHRRSRRRLDFDEGQEPAQGDVPLLVLPRPDDNNEENDQADDVNPAFNEFLGFIMAWEGVENPVPSPQQANTEEDPSSPASGRSLY